MPQGMIPIRGGAVLALLLAIVCVGCGDDGVPPSSSSAGNPVLGPHQGVVFKLPGDQGFIELTVELEGKGMVIAAYGLKPDLKSPLDQASAPADLKVKIQERDSETSRDVPLVPKAKPSSKDAASLARFASSPGAYGLNAYDGELSGMLGGQSFAVKAHRSDGK